jgi:predicted nucleotidyltransferase
LYGSHAWGTPNADSDIDLLLIENTQEPFIDRIRDVNRMLTGKIPVDVMVVNPQEYSTLSNSSSFYKQIASKGKVVYGRI